MPSALKRARTVGIGLLLVFTLVGLAPQAATAQGVSHVVKSGETLAAIAKSYGIPVSSIAQANGITNPNRVYAGQKLVIPDGVPAPAPEAAPPSSENPVYTVERGDTLGGIAATYGTTAAAIAGANGLTSPDRIREGMRLVIPEGSAPASPSPARPTKFVVDISSQHCKLYAGKTVIESWTCSTGRSSSPTKTGTFRVQSKLRRAYGSRWNLVMPYWLGIYWAGPSENGIHGLPWNAKSGKRTWAGMVGTRITYGCVMLNDSAAKKLWDKAYIGMPVIIQR